MPSLGETSRRAAQRELDRLREEYDIDVVERRDPVPGDEFESFEPFDDDVDYVGGGGAWVTDDRGRVLLIRDVDRPETWSAPGGGREPGETFADAARREVREETGSTVALGEPFLAERLVWVHEDDPERGIHYVGVFYHATTDGGSPDPADDEIAELAWHETPPSNLNPVFADAAAATFPRE